MLPRMLYLLLAFGLCGSMQGAAEFSRSSRIGEGKIPQSTFSEDKKALFLACQTCDTARAIMLIARNRGKFSAAEEQELTETTISSCGEFYNGTTIIAHFAQAKFNFNNFKRFPPLFYASLIAAKSCNLSLVRILLAGEANPYAPFLYKTMLANTYDLFEIFAQSNDCGPCTKEVFSLFSIFNIDESPDIGDTNQNYSDEKMQSEYIPVIVPVPMPEPATPEDEQSSQSGNSAGSSYQSQGGGSGQGSGVNNWGNWMGDFWNNL